MSAKKKKKKKGTGTTVPQGKSVCYVYLDDKNLEYVTKLSNQTGRSKSHCLDKIVESVRKDIDLVIEENVPKFVRQAQEYARKKGMKVSDL